MEINYSLLDYIIFNYFLFYLKLIKSYNKVVLEMYFYKKLLFFWFFRVMKCILVIDFIRLLVYVF